MSSICKRKTAKQIQYTQQMISIQWCQANQQHTTKVLALKSSIETKTREGNFVKCVYLSRSSEQGRVRAEGGGDDFTHHSNDNSNTQVREGSRWIDQLFRNTQEKLNNFDCSAATEGRKTKYLLERFL